jgi:hypothetical protein
MPIGTDTTGKVYAYDPLTKKFPTITGGDLTLNPGYYPGGIDMSNGNVVLNPGVYALGGAGVKNASNRPGLVINGGTFTADEGVLLYITGDPSGTRTGVPTEYGRIDIGGNAAVTIISRGAAGNLPVTMQEEHIALWQDRENSTYGKIVGGGSCVIEGTIYCGYNPMEIGGSSEQMGNQLIVGALNLHGGINLGIAYDGRNAIEPGRAVIVE